jgi:hypothetical protein
MKRNSLAHVAAALASVAMVMPTASFAVTTEPSFQAADVALRPGGMLVGQVVDQQGVAKANAPVSVQYGNHEVVRTTTDAHGVFAAKGLRGGQYQLVTQDGMTVCRLWAPETAPPVAEPAALVVSGGDAVRGQWGGGPMHNWVGGVQSHPDITAGVIAAAIAIPLALADDDDPAGS